MDSWGTILGGWAIVLAVLALYAAWLLLRARVVARELHLGDGDQPVPVERAEPGS
jgi:hypothetical protein